MEEYPRYVTKGFKPFDPLELAKRTEGIVGHNSSRKYTAFYCTGVYRGISTAYTVGCCLRCVFCWVSFSRDFPEEYGEFYTPEEVFENLVSNARKSKVKSLRISGGEPTLCRTHLLKVLDLVTSVDFLFILESNGILLGHDPSYAKALKKYPNIYVRISLKAGTAEGFQRRTGAIGDYYKLPFQAIKNLKRAGVSFHVASMSDPRLMPISERREMFKNLRDVDYWDYLEEETCDPYDTSLIRLEKAGFDIWK
ncbi:MAG: radical SAM protein [Actinomycetota bacterium]|nr:radical SAM protein [Actinomycetota bacterium]